MGCKSLQFSIIMGKLWSNSLQITTYSLTNHSFHQQITHFIIKSLASLTFIHSITHLLHSQHLLRSHHNTCFAYKTCFASLLIIIFQKCFVLFRFATQTFAFILTYHFMFASLLDRVPDRLFCFATRTFSSHFPSLPQMCFVFSFW